MEWTISRVTRRLDGPQARLERDQVDEQTWPGCPDCGRPVWPGVRRVGPLSRVEITGEWSCPGEHTSSPQHATMRRAPTD